MSKVTDEKNSSQFVTQKKIKLLNLLNNTEFAGISYFEQKKGP